MLGAQARRLLLGGQRITLANARPGGERGLVLALASQCFTGERERVELAGHAGDDAGELRARLPPGDQRVVIQLGKEPVRHRVLALLGLCGEQHIGVARGLRFGLLVFCVGPPLDGNGHPQAAQRGVERRSRWERRELGVEPAARSAKLASDASISDCLAASASTAARTSASLRRATGGARGGA